MNALNALLDQYRKMDEYTSAFDQIELLDAIVKELSTREDQELVVFKWTNDYECYDCGLPAAFALPFAYGTERSVYDPLVQRCSVCAANAAVDGETVVRIFA